MNVKFVKFSAFRLTLLLNSIVFVQMQSFFDVPPPEYYGRTSLKDCEERFYPRLPDPYSSAGFSAVSSGETIAVANAGASVGVRVFNTEYQHMAAIGWTSGKTIYYLCGGSLISNRFVLTAAHCKFDDNGNEPDTVRLGDTDLENLEDDEHAQQIKIAHIIRHPYYTLGLKYFDVALIKLQHEAQFTKAVCPACLWQEKELPTEPLNVIGFGALWYGGESSPTLQRVVVKPVEKKECQRRFKPKKVFFQEGYREEQFCTAGKGMDTCEGDSGGPVGVRRSDVGGEVISLVAGVVSFGQPCTYASVGVHTKVSKFVDWIEATTGESMSYQACIKERYCPGRPQLFNDVPYYGSNTESRFGLLWSNDNSPQYNCGATLIDYRYLLTTASCVTTSKGYPEYIISKDGERVRVINTFVSPGYTKPGQLTNDIALLEISQYANHTVYPPVCLSDRGMNKSLQFTPKFSAFGREPGRSVSVYASGSKKCYENELSGTDLHCFSKNTVPLVPRSCWMDHGGPVIAIGHSKRAVTMCGIVSPCSTTCDSDLVMIDVSPHIPWIESIMFGTRVDTRFSDFSKNNLDQHFELWRFAKLLL